MNYSYNLIDRGWISSTMSDGTYRELGLLDTLLGADGIREIRDGSPLVTAALHRLLLAILHRVYGPATQEEWLALWDGGKGRLDEAALRAYFDQWSGRFDLFHPRTPFYQVAGLVTGRSSPISRLQPELASGNNAVLFDHSRDDQVLALPAPAAARMLVGHQAFALGGGKSDTGYLTHAPLVGGVTVLLFGQSLLQTLLLNLTRYRRGTQPEYAAGSEDLPVWERDDGPPPISRLLTGPVDLLTWRSRAVRLEPTGPMDSPQVASMSYAQGDTMSDGERTEPFWAYRVDEKRGRLPVRMNPRRALWRDSTAFLDLSGRAEHPPEAIRWTAYFVGSGALLTSEAKRLEVFGLATNRAKVELWRQEQLPLPLAYLASPDLVERLGNGVQVAETVAKALRTSVWVLAIYLNYPDADLPEARSRDREVINRTADSLDPSPRYWSALEVPFHRLLTDLPADGDAAAGEWLDVVLRVAFAAYSAVVGGLADTGRDLKARTQGERALSIALARIGSEHEGEVTE